MTSSLQDVPIFTSSLQMWSPSPSILLLSNYSVAPTTTYESRFEYYHDPVLYHTTACCMICGLAHHSIPYTAMKEEDEKESTSRNKPLITPAPQFNTLEPQQSFHHRDFDKLPISRKPLSLQRIKHFLLTMATRCGNAIKKKAPLSIQRKKSLIYPIIIKRYHRSRLEKHRV